MLPPDLMAMSLTYKERKVLRRAGRGQVVSQGGVRRLREIWLWADDDLTDLGRATLEELRGG